MGQMLTISPIGLKLIKSYEGFRPSVRLLVSGQRVVGYGHRVDGSKEITVSKAAADRLLRNDLEPFEEMINENVHAPLSQSQFDALCSLAFNIGPKAFLSSNVLHALNNGRPLDAANCFDAWRKSNIDGRTYVVDALVRRRTAEKSLFLRPEGRKLPASRIDLPPEEDRRFKTKISEDSLPIFTGEDAEYFIADAPYSASEGPLRRREDRTSSALSESDYASVPVDKSDYMSSENIPAELKQESATLSLTEENILLEPSQPTPLETLLEDEVDSKDERDFSQEEIILIDEVDQDSKSGSNETVSVPAINGNERVSAELPDYEDILTLQPDTILVTPDPKAPLYNGAFSKTPFDQPAVKTTIDSFPESGEDKVTRQSSEAQVTKQETPLDPTADILSETPKITERSAPAEDLTSLELDESLMLDETVEGVTAKDPEALPLPVSSIAEAAAEVSEQLDALFDGPSAEDGTAEIKTAEDDSSNETNEHHEMAKTTLTSDEIIENMIEDKGEEIQSPEMFTEPLDELVSGSFIDVGDAPKNSPVVTEEQVTVHENLDTEQDTAEALILADDVTTSYSLEENEVRASEPGEIEGQMENTETTVSRPLSTSQKIRTMDDETLEEESVRDSSDKYIKRDELRLDRGPSADESPYAVMMVLGLTLISGFLVAILRGPALLLGESGPLIAAAGFMIGVMIFTGALYYFLRAIFRGRKKLDGKH